ncbi:hypothetical protein [Butyrivibrio virus Ceridwen]|nr:hypothetical protein [Butyrivibrio virus Ceridwen]
MKREAINELKKYTLGKKNTEKVEISVLQLNRVIKALEQEPCCNCIEFKRYAKQMGFEIEKQSIPYLMHKEMNIPISECQKAYDVAVDYLRSQGKLKG